MQNDKLLPCPFCGGEAFVDTHKFWDVEEKDFTVKTYGVRCYECQAGTMQYFRTEEDAIKQWNTRKPMGDVASKVQQVIWDSCCGDEYKYASKEIEKIFDEVYWEGGVDNAG